MAPRRMPAAFPDPQTADDGLRGFPAASLRPPLVAARPAISAAGVAAEAVQAVAAVAAHSPAGSAKAPLRGRRSGGQRSLCGVRPSGRPRSHASRPRPGCGAFDGRSRLSMALAWRGYLVPCFVGFRLGERTYAATCSAICGKGPYIWGALSGTMYRKNSARPQSAIAGDSGGERRDDGCIIKTHATEADRAAPRPERAWSGA
jgi:hypothetical protein